MSRDARIIINRQYILYRPELKHLLLMVVLLIKSEPGMSGLALKWMKLKSNGTKLKFVAFSDN